MSRSKSKRSAPKYQRAKLACLPFLLAVLGYALMPGSQAEDETPAPLQVASLTAAAPRAQPARPAGGEAPAAQSTTQPDWSALAAAPRAKCNPFLPIVKEEEEQETPPPLPPELQPEAAPPSEAELAAIAEPTAEPAPVPERPAVDVTALSQQPVRYFFQTNNRRVMLVGDQLLSEGQALDSFTVTRLEPDRIELEPADAQRPR